MAKFNAKKRLEISQLLSEHRGVVEALKVVMLIGWYSSIYLTKESGEDTASVSIPADIAKRALSDQKARLEKKLATLGFEIE
jgi:hypothetical protein